MDSTESKETIICPGCNSNRHAGPTSEAASHIAPSYHLIFGAEKVFLSPWPLADWDIKFIPEKYTLPYRSTPSTPVWKGVVVHDPRILRLDFSLNSVAILP